MPEVLADQSLQEKKTSARELTLQDILAKKLFVKLGNRFSACFLHTERSAGE